MPRNEELSLSSLGIQMPYNMQAEQSVLGAALMDETVLNRLITDCLLYTSPGCPAGRGTVKIETDGGNLYEDHSETGCQDHR